MEASRVNGKFCLKVHQAYIASNLLHLLTDTIASDYIKSLENSNKVGRQAQTQLSQIGLEFDTVKRENESLRSENSRLYQEMQHYREGSRQPVIPPPQYAASHAPMLADPCRSLPPLMNGAPIGNPINNPINSSMQGVQYSDERR